MGCQNPGIEKKTGTGIITGIEIKEGIGTERGNGIATTDIIGIGRNTETILTTMIITEAVILKGIYVYMHLIMLKKQCFFSKSGHFGSC
jgi:hypothetical protein